MNISSFLLILANTLMLVSGQFLWKYGLMQREKPFESIRTIIEVILSPYIIGGLFIYGCATVLWLFILTRVDLSLAYPIQSLAYIISIIGAYYFFGESLSMLKIVGCLLILAGVACIGFSGKYA
ncbi:EamA-like transporter family protein [Paenibacillus taihuensis]|uniref:EamA-like transporter family protein n=1 Tax=Paenibacillus taihuensis TaxID=1156355 RepID=A0A3D9Q3Y0_9BACL|nr:EamA family transporter [Paenibacillus taihuensis]REE56476.1 EamA-like transporter family protein [Paenibacillus taihuensis]